MIHGICNLSIVPIRREASEQSEMVSQLLFGESFKVLEQDKYWSKIETSFDHCIGFVDNKQIQFIDEEDFTRIQQSELYLSGEIIDYITTTEQELTTIPLGAILPFYNQKNFTLNRKNYHYDGKVYHGKLSKAEVIQTAFMYLNTPFLWGGKTPFGIDSSGFTQMVYKICGYTLGRTAEAQSKQGEVLSFIEESEPGDLAFFDNEDGEIIHVGIILRDYHIIHSFGKVRVDTLDHSGVFNAELQKHTHKLRVIKKII